METAKFLMATQPKMALLHEMR